MGHLLGSLNLPILLLFWQRKFIFEEAKGRVIYQLSRQNNSNRGN